MTKQVLKKSDLTGSEYQNAEHAERKRGTRGRKTARRLTLPRVPLFPHVPRFQNSIFNPNWAFLAPKALVDLPKSGLDVSPTGETRFTRLKRLKNSARKRRFAPSLPRNHGILVFFARVKSVLA